MSLENWRQNGWLARKEPTLPEITQLFAVVDREIADADSEGLSIDGRFMHAYDAALILCKIALRANGFNVAKGSGHHKRLIESLTFTLGEDMRDTADQFEYASRRRGQAMYDSIDVVEKEDADELLESAIETRGRLINYLKESFPELLPSALE